MYSQPKYLTAAAGGLLAGCVAGAISVSILALSVQWPLLGRRDDFVYIYLPGTIFGVAISVYGWLFHSRRSLLRAVGFVAICTGTHFAMVLLAGLLTIVIGRSNSRWIRSANPGFVGTITGFFVAGTLGAFLAALLLLFTVQRVRGMAWIALRWSLFGGALASLSWFLELFYRSSPLVPFEYLFFVWQSGIGFVLGLILQKEPSTT